MSSTQWDNAVLETKGISTCYLVGGIDVVAEKAIYEFIIDLR